MSKKIVFAMLVVVMFSMGQTCTPDADMDGVKDSDDSCPNTPLCATVDALGCPSDSDNDGVMNGCDECEDTPAGDTVHGNGCTVDPGGSVPSRCQGPDPRAKAIEYSLVGMIDANRANIQIKGVVENIGLSNYDSGPDQQDIQLWEDDAMVHSVQFEDLAVDETIYIEYQREWDLGDEFLPGFYKVIITYDPDIRDDGNLNNDDCRETNNMVVRRASDINSLLE
ncbi:MAG: hypothetical protein JSV03_06130 [Planctomycetota bacterium]|nr:MAG: hypothetical protein JSV03_06130 [Planctomycetota bacterium]